MKLSSFKSLFRRIWSSRAKAKPSALLLALLSRINGFPKASSQFTPLHLPLDGATLETLLKENQNRTEVVAEIKITNSTVKSIPSDLIKKLQTAISFAFERSSCKWLRSESFRPEKIIRQHSVHFFSLLDNAVAWTVSIVFLPDKILIQNPIISSKSFPKDKDFKNRNSSTEIQIDHITGTWKGKRICNLHLTGIRDRHTYFDEADSYHLRDKFILSQIKDRNDPIIPQNPNCPQQLLYYSLSLKDLIYLAHQSGAFKIGSSVDIEQRNNGVFRTNIPFSPETGLDENTLQGLNDKLKDDVVILDLRGDGLSRLQSSKFRFDATILISDSESRKKTSSAIGNDCRIISFCDEQPDHRIEASYLLDNKRINLIPEDSVFEVHFAINSLREDRQENADELHSMFFLNERGQSIFEFKMPQA